MRDTKLQIELEVDEPLRREYSVHVSEDCPYFEGHFPGHPVLPGVAQLETLVLELALQSWPQIGSLHQLRRLKFKRIIAPDSSLRLSLLRQKETQVKFTLKTSDGDEECCAGTLCFGEAHDAG